MVSYYSRVTKKGQTTILSAFREKFGIEAGDRVVFEDTSEGLVLRRVSDFGGFSRVHVAFR